jgi:hypothetical protein
MYHPWFVCFQVIYDFSPKKGLNITAYLNTITLRPGENVVIFAGDTEGFFFSFENPAKFLSINNLLINIRLISYI